MKNLNSSIFVFVLVLFFSFGATIFAQNMGGNVVVVNNSEVRFFPEFSMSEFDSLTAEYNTWVMDKNDVIISYKVVRHWWGHNNRDFVTIVEVASWDDVLAFNQKANELFEAHWDTPEKRKAFNDAYNKYFTGQHSDEIYQEVVFESN